MSPHSFALLGGMATALPDSLSRDDVALFVVVALAGEQIRHTIVRLLRVVAGTVQALAPLAAAMMAAIAAIMIAFADVLDGYR